MAKEFKVLNLILENIPKELHKQLLQEAKEYLIDSGEKFVTERTDEEVKKEIEDWAQSNKANKIN